MPAIFAQWFGSLLGVLLVSTILTWILRKILPFDPKIIAAVSVVVAAFAAPAIYAWSSDGRNTYGDTAVLYLSAGIVAIPIMWKLTKDKLQGKK